MHPESIGFSPHHCIKETYCDGCGCPESSGEHGMDCYRYDEENS